MKNIFFVFTSECYKHYTYDLVKHLFMLFLLDNIFVWLGTNLYKQIFDIPQRTYLILKMIV